MRGSPKRSILRDAAVKAAKADRSIAQRTGQPEQPTFWNNWRDPWNEICSKLTPVLEELGFSHVKAEDGAYRFATLPDRVLAALNELRVLPQEKNNGTL